MRVILSLPGSMVLLQILKRNITLSPSVKDSRERWISTCPNPVRLAQASVIRDCPRLVPWTCCAIFDKFGHLSASPSSPIFCPSGLDHKPPRRGACSCWNAYSTNKRDGDTKDGMVVVILTRHCISKSSCFDSFLHGSWQDQDCRVSSWVCPKPILIKKIIIIKSPVFRITYRSQKGFFFFSPCVIRSM